MHREQVTAKMSLDKYGRYYCSSDELCDLLYLTPDMSFDGVLVSDPEDFNCSVKSLHLPYRKLEKFSEISTSVEEFDEENQNYWYMPDEYKNFDIAQWVLDQCVGEAALQRAGQELLMFQERKMFDLLRFMKFFVDTMRKNKLIWGVGRGSSVASYVLYLIGVHRIDALYFDLDITEFLK